MGIVAIIVIQHVYTSRGLRSWGIHLGLFGSLFVTVLPIFFSNPVAMIFTIPMATILVGTQPLSGE